MNKVIVSCGMCNDPFEVDDIHEVVQTDEDGTEFVDCIEYLCSECWEFKYGTHESREDWVKSL